MQRFSITTLVLAVAMALAIALPAEAKKPDRPGKPDTGFKPVSCHVDDAFLEADVRNTDGTTHVVLEGTRAFTLITTESGGFNETQYTVTPDGPGLDDVLCVEVTLSTGTLRDLRVRWLGCQDCGLYRATGKDLRIFNDGEVFSAGVGVANWTDPGEVTVAVMPLVRTETATMTVMIGIEHP